MKVYNKLVRDKIPEIINNDNRKAIIRILNNEEYFNELKQKLQEEVKEYLEDNNIEELADIVEVIYGILNAKNISTNDIASISIFFNILVQYPTSIIIYLSLCSF